MNAATLSGGSVRRVMQDAGRHLPRHEVERILSHALDLPPLELYLHDRALPQPLCDRLSEMVRARAAGAPLQYVLGEAEFFGARFSVRPGVFIPRPETEIIVEAALRAFRGVQRGGRPLRILEFGVGSGCIAVTLARELPACLLVGIEVSWDALAVARLNAERQGVASRVALIQGEWERPIRGTFDGVIANPPYVPSAQVNRLPLEVRQEPRQSLDGGVDGLRDLRHLLGVAPHVLHPGGVAVFECGEEQVPVLIRQARQARWAAEAAALFDLANRPRGVVITGRS